MPSQDEPTQRPPKGRRIKVPQEVAEFAADAIRAFLIERQEQAKAAIAKVESYRAPGLENWCDQTASHWKNVAMAIAYLASTIGTHEVRRILRRRMMEES